MRDLGALRWSPVPCALCGSSLARTVAEVTRYSVPLRILRCRPCGHVYLSPRVVDADLPKLYDEEYYTGHGEYAYADDRENPEAAALRAGARLERIEELVPPGRLLEVGCSFGAFLLEARRRGWEVTGLDVSDYAVDHCRARGITVLAGTLEIAPLDPESYDVVYLSETVEHLPRPRETVAAAAKVLAPRGVLVLATANHASLARLLRGARWGYYMPGHFQYFTARSLGRLMEEEGLAIVRRRFGDDRSVARLRRIRRAEGRRSGILAGRSERLRRLRLGGFSAGAGMVIYGRKEPE